MLNVCPFDTWTVHVMVRSNLTKCANEFYEDSYKGCGSQQTTKKLHYSILKENEMF